MSSLPAWNINSIWHQNVGWNVGGAGEECCHSAKLSLVLCVGWVWFIIPVVWWIAVLRYCLRGIIKMDLSRLYIEHDITEGGPTYSKYVLEDGWRSNKQIPERREGTWDTSFINAGPAWSRSLHCKDSHCTESTYLLWRQIINWWMLLFCHWRCHHASPSNVNRSQVLMGSVIKIRNNVEQDSCYICMTETESSRLKSPRLLPQMT